MEENEHLSAECDNLQAENGGLQNGIREAKESFEAEADQKNLLLDQKNELERKTKELAEANARNGQSISRLRGRLNELEKALNSALDERKELIEEQKAEYEKMLEKEKGSQTSLTHLLAESQKTLEGVGNTFNFRSVLMFHLCLHTFHLFLLRHG